MRVFAIFKKKTPFQEEAIFKEETFVKMVQLDLAYSNTNILHIAILRDYQ